MRLVKSTYRTLSGVKEVIEIEKRNTTQWIIYQNDSPKYYVDLYDLSNESNAMMNSLVLCARRSIDETLELLNRKHNIKLSIPKISKIGLKKKLKSEKVEISLEPLPEKWLAYSL